MAHFSFLIALSVNAFFFTGVEEVAHPCEVPQLVQEYFKDAYSPYLLLRSSELGDRCTLLVLQQLFKQRIESSPAWVVGSEATIFQSQIEIIKKDGFSEDELRRVKQQLLSQMQSYCANVASQAISESAALEAQAVLNASGPIIEKMQLVDLSVHLASFIEDAPQSLSFIYPKSVPNTWVFDTANMSIHFADYSLNKEPLFFINNSSAEIEPFYQLPLEEKEQKLIYELIKTLAEKNIWGLLFKKKELEKLGKKVNVVHPIRFIAYILSEPKLKKWLKEMRNSTFKWDHFIEGFAERMKDENMKNNLTAYVAGMAHLLHVEPSQIMGFIHAKDYEGLVKSFL